MQLTDNTKSKDRRLLPNLDRKLTRGHTHIINNTIFIGLDVHKDTTAAAIAKAKHEGSETSDMIFKDSMGIMKFVRRSDTQIAIASPRISN